MFVEPNAFEHQLHKNVSTTQLAADFRLLHTTLKDDPEFSGKFPRSKIVGPSTTIPGIKSMRYLSQYVFCCSRLLLWLFVNACRRMFGEPNDFVHALHKNVSAIQLAADFGLLHAILKDDSEFSGKFATSSIVGHQLLDRERSHWAICRSTCVCCSCSNQCYMYIFIHRQDGSTVEIRRLNKI